MSEPTRTVERCLHVAAPRADVYRALLDPAALSRWMYATVQWKPEKGASYRIDWQDSSVPDHAQGEILEMEEGRRLVLSWFMQRDGCETVASFDLEDGEDGGSWLKFRHAGFPGGSEWQSRFDMVALEWEKVLENLRFHVEEGRGGGAPFYLRLQVELPASRERVHAHWVGPWALSAWLAREAFVDPAAGGAFELLLLDGGEASGVIRTLSPGKHMRMLWREGDRKSLLGISFWTAPEGSVMTLTQRSYAIPEAERGAVRARWEERFARLKAALGREPGGWPAGTGGRRIDLERTIDAPRERVWKAFGEAAGLAAWFCDRAEFTPRRGNAFTFLWTGYGEQRGKVLDADPGARLRLSWDVPAAEATTTVEIQCQTGDTDPAQTRISIAHAGWGTGGAWDAEWNATRTGWRSCLAMVEFYLRDGARGPRRSFLLRRRVPIPPAELWRRFSTADGLASWFGQEAVIEPREEGTLRVRLADGSWVEGRVTVAEPSGGIAVLLKSPEPAYVEFGWGGTEEGSVVLVSGLTYGEPESWTLRQRILWAERIGRIAGA